MTMVTWYPRRELVEWLHDELIRELGGRLGYLRDPSLITNSGMVNPMITEKEKQSLKETIQEHYEVLKALNSGTKKVIAA